MLHVRVVTPASLCPELLRRLDANRAVHNIVTFPGAAKRPDGDLVQFDVAREAANGLLASLRDMDLHRCGSIAIERIDTSLSDVAAAAEAYAPGDPSEAIVWEEVEARVRDESTLSFSFVATMAVAVLIAAVGILTDSSVLIVGAMVVGPDYGPIAGITLNLHRRRMDRVWKSVIALAVGYGVATLCALAMSVIVRLIDKVPNTYAAGARPLTSFIAKPDGWSIVVAVLAGIAGTLALTEAKAGTIVGVLISVTTIPAAGNIAVALANGRGGEAGGALVQLLLNVVVMIATGFVVLAMQRRFTQSPIRKRAR